MINFKNTRLNKHCLIFGLVIFSCLSGFSQIELSSSISDSARIKDPECQLTGIPEEIIICTNSDTEIEIEMEEGMLKWYDDKGGLMDESEYVRSYTTPVLNESSTYFVQAVCPYSDAQKKHLETHWNGGNGKEGVMFSLKAIREVKLQSLDIHCEEGTYPCHVFFIQGDMEQNMNNPGAWTPVFDGLISGKGEGVSVNIDIEDLDLEQNEKYGIYVTLEDDHKMYYSNGDRSFGNDYLELSNSKGVSWPFGPVCGMREFNGKLNFVVGERATSIKYPIDIIVIDEPESPAVYFNGTSFEVFEGDGFQWYLNGKIIENANDAVYYPEESGMFSVAAYTGECLSEMSDGLFYEESVYLPDDDVITVYPNPVMNELKINLAEAPKDSYRVVISDSNGLLKKDLMISGGAESSVDVSDLSSGQYYITIKSDRFNYSSGILKW